MVERKVALHLSQNTFNFTGNTPAPPNSYWDFGDLSIITDTSTAANPSYTYASSGNYTVMYVAIDSSTCNIADTVPFNVQLVIAPVFSATLDFDPPPRCGADSFVVDLLFTGTGQDSLIWDMGDGTIYSNIDSISYLYPEAGSYNITLFVLNNLCGDKSISNEVTFIQKTSSESIIPNVFTPNGDGMNDELEFSGIDQRAEYSIQIFNRWGNKVFEMNNYDNSWGGIANVGINLFGTQLPTGTYFVKVFDETTQVVERVLKIK